MAKVNITVDTDEKTVEVKVDGEVQDSVSYVGISSEESGYFGIDISMISDVDKTMRKVTRLVASKESQTGEVSKSKYKGLYKVEEDILTADDLAKLIRGI